MAFPHITTSISFRKVPNGPEANIVDAAAALVVISIVVVVVIAVGLLVAILGYLCGF